MEDWRGYISFGQVQLLYELAATTSFLADLHAQIGFLRAEEARGVMEGKPSRLQLEGDRDALIEKKFFLIRLLDLQREKIHAPV